MSEVLIREASLDDIIRCTKHHERRDTLVGFMAMSDRTFVAEVNGAIVCTWGVMRQSLLADRGYLWLLVSEAAEDHKFLIIRKSQRIIDDLLTHYRYLSGECLIGDARAQRWMRFLGAKFSHPEGKTIPFLIERKHG